MARACISQVSVETHVPLDFFGKALFDGTTNSLHRCNGVVGYVKPKTTNQRCLGAIIIHPTSG